MYVCKECGEIFEEPEHCVERHGFTDGMYEEWDGCPECGGNYTEAFCCDLCGEYIQGDYIETKNGTLICENCYEVKDIDEAS